MKSRYPQDKRFLIVAFDGLRPDMVCRDLTPNLVNFCRNGSHCIDSRAVFPTETRVNQASLVTGCYPAQHGMVANKFIEKSTRGLLNTADFKALSRADDELDGILTTISLGEILHNAGEELAVLGCGTAGGNRLLHNKAKQFDNLNISLHGLEKTTTPASAKTLIEAFNPIPNIALPNKAQIDWLVDAYMQEVAVKRDPLVTIIWFSDPDTTFHYRGIESDEAAEAIKHADAAFGRLLSWRKKSNLKDNLQIIALSDHGHVATHGPAQKVQQQFEDAGFNFSADTGPNLITGTTASLYVQDNATLLKIISWLQKQRWCGLIFSRPIHGLQQPSGTLPLTSVNLNHPRTGDVVFVLGRDSIAPNGRLGGRCLHDNPDIPIGCGLHGGLSPFEVRTLLAFSGNLFLKNKKLTIPTGIIDILPTILHSLGFPYSKVDGRILHEILASPGRKIPKVERKKLVAKNNSGYQQMLNKDIVFNSEYLDFGIRNDIKALS